MALIVCFLCDIMGVVGQVERLGGGPKEGGGSEEGALHHVFASVQLSPLPI